MKENLKELFKNMKLSKSKIKEAEDLIYYISKTNKNIEKSIKRILFSTQVLDSLLLYSCFISMLCEEYRYEIDKYSKIKRSINFKEKQKNEI